MKTKHICDHCNESFEKSKDAKEHELKCEYDPKHRNCHSCRHKYFDAERNTMGMGITHFNKCRELDSYLTGHSEPPIRKNCKHWMKPKY